MVEATENSHPGCVDKEKPLEDGDGNEVRSLARQFTRQSTRQSIDSVWGKNPLGANEGSELDPNSDAFSPKKWTRAMFTFLQADDRFMGRTAGVSFRSLSAYGYGRTTDYQNSVGNAPLKLFNLFHGMTGGGQRQIHILQDFDGLLRAGEMLVVLGPPGSGCSTILKTIAGETHGFFLSKETSINYQGISYDQMHKYFRGEAIYTAEQDIHFPMMTVGDTLYFAALARAPKYLPAGISKHEWAIHHRNVIMATFRIRHTINTKVGNDFVRGVSGGERKRVSIAEAALSNAPLQCWDNSTRGLDSANAIDFCRTLRTETQVAGTAAAVAIYQAPQAAYDLFDKVLVLYEGRQIYFGLATDGRQYFTDLGFECPQRQTTPDFLTSMTNPAERIVRSGFERQAPRTADEFAAAWKRSAAHKALIKEIEAYNQHHSLNGDDLDKFQQSRQLQQAKGQRLKSPFTLSYLQQVRLCLWRGFKRLEADPSLTLTQLFGNFIMALIIGSVFYNLEMSTHSFFQRGALIFFAILLNAFGSALEILTLYAQRAIVEKHSRYALYHASAEAFASMLTDIPYKVANAVIFNLTLYFMTNLRREPGPFFFFLLTSFIATLVTSMIFRTIAACSRTLEQALAPAAILILVVVIYTGFAIPTTYMLGWSRWMNYLNPMSYAFEALMANEFSGQIFDCTSQLVPPYGEIQNQVCTAVGSIPGERFVHGAAYIASAFDYSASHKWRNIAVVLAFTAFFMATYLGATESISAKKSKGEVLIFRRGHTPFGAKARYPTDVESVEHFDNLYQQKQMRGSDEPIAIQRQTAIFQWRDVCYDVKVKGESRRILDNVDGWVKPGTLTALMGVSGAGKTTLLDVLAARVTMGVIGGEMLIDGVPRDTSFQRKTGYVQQQDLHLSTSTVREALNFSALLRQPHRFSRQEKLDYVEEVIRLLDMEAYADAIVGVPGDGLNVEQRKRLTIGVELVAKPQLLLFLDEPTSGLDSQTSWSILQLLQKLRANGQAILCTIHQPSAMLFECFDRLLFLAKGGRTVYFGPLGHDAYDLRSYFVRNGAQECPAEANPAEWILEVIGAAPGSHSSIDWPTVWRGSPEYQAVQGELEQMKRERSQQPNASSDAHNDSAMYREFAAPFLRQYLEVQRRIFEQYWRTPSYIYSKILLVTLSALFIGFSLFMAENTLRGLQNQMFGVFTLLVLFGQLVEQIMPLFVSQRTLYEARERPSKTYSWQAFILSNMVVEIPWNLLCAILVFFCWYFPMGLYRNAEESGTESERGALMFLYVVCFLFFTSTFAQMVVAPIETAETAGNIANLMFSMCLVFCG